MTKYEPRQPKTPEEIRVARQEKQIRAVTMAMSMGFYIAIFLFVPEVPNSDFYWMLDSFLNSYCLGDIMPSFSPDFHFAMKVAWCLSLPYSLFLVLIFATFIHTRMGKEGIKMNLEKNAETKNMRLAFLLFLMTLCFILAGFVYSIAPYAFDMSSARGGRGTQEIFHGNFIKSTLLFLFLHVFFVRGGIYFALLQLYFTFFVKEVHDGDDE